MVHREVLLSNDRVGTNDYYPVRVLKAVYCIPTVPVCQSAAAAYASANIARPVDLHNSTMLPILTSLVWMVN